MRYIHFLTCALAAAATSASAQVAAPSAQPQPEERALVSAAEVQAMIAAAGKPGALKPGQPLLLQPLVGLSPYRANLEYRVAVGPAVVHEKHAEFFTVVEGAGTLVTGGRLAGEKRTNAMTRIGTAIEGGTDRRVGKGDVFIVPQNVPHQFIDMPVPLVLISLHVPRE
jgi:mannose-6-phosphate isomerase-like protein (cupin superfamily)